MADVVIFGAGDTAQLMAFYFKQVGEHRIVGFTVDADRFQATSFEGRPVVPWEELERHFSPSEVRLFAPISYAKLNTVRRERFFEGRSRGYRFISFIHPSVSYYGTPVGENCLIFQGTYVMPYSQIGDNVMIWGGGVGHHSRIGDHCFLTQAHVSANTSLGPRCFISFSDVIDGVTIGEACVVARGAFVTRSLPAGTVVVGAPSEVSKVPSHRLRGL